ncbi:hypothetical protein GRI97_11715 [Altererythrobacter xixiisoli]|uniref:Uncharacterized protein n=1 Tax=Croceibacterium xixiisoli TaxID=1476466 RepID=A0A6I4TUC2_9SPHN|nr:hypothetical protein [Croceibacterium xixiisoli]MXO99656.1 hypothetical protein [Croceibacterium xixiisoli]
MSRKMPAGAITAMRLGLLAGGLPLLSGCVMAVAVPALTGASYVSERKHRYAPTVAAASSADAGLASSNAATPVTAQADMADQALIPPGDNADTAPAPAIASADDSVVSTTGNPALITPSRDDTAVTAPAPSATGSVASTTVSPALAPPRRDDTAPAVPAPSATDNVADTTVSPALALPSSDDTAPATPAPSAKNSVASSMGDLALIPPSGVAEAGPAIPAPSAEGGVVGTMANPAFIPPSDVAETGPAIPAPAANGRVVGTVANPAFIPPNKHAAAGPAIPAPGADGGVVSTTVDSAFIPPSDVVETGSAMPAPAVGGSVVRTVANPAYQSGSAVPATGSELAPVARADTPSQDVPAALAMPGRTSPQRRMEGPAGDWYDFVTFALRRADARKRGEAVSSVILSTESAFSLKPEYPICQARDNAVLIDLDRGSGSLLPGVETVPATGLAHALSRLRSAEVVVLWVSSLHGNNIIEVGDALRKSGLDPAGRDPILLARNDGERKQMLRVQANEDVCVIAMAGDQRSDFDELFDFLQNPGERTPLDSMIGNGWFLAPPPLGLLGQEGR